VGRAILPADQLSIWSSRLKRRLDHDWPPHEEKYAVLGGSVCLGRDREAERPSSNLFAFRVTLL